MEDLDTIMGNQVADNNPHCEKVNNLLVGVNWVTRIVNGWSIWWDSGMWLMEYYMDQAYLFTNKSILAWWGTNSFSFVQTQSCRLKCGLCEIILLLFAVLFHISYTHTNNRNGLLSYLVLLLRILFYILRRDLSKNSLNNWS